MWNQNLFGLGHTEIIIILVVLFILFGHRLPSVMRAVGRRIMGMEVNPYESPRKPDSQKRDRRGDHYPYWLTAIDVLMILVVLAVLATLFMPG